MLNDNRIRIIIGHYGSGKTEFAVNYAMKLADQGKKVALGDLDVVNPYFRSREKQDIMEEKGIKVIGNSLGMKSGVDLPAVSASVLAPIQDESYDLVLDVGGDAVGARALARYYASFKEGNYDMFCVLNANRPGTQNVEDAVEHIKGIEATSRTKVTGIINSTHLLRETTVKDVLVGQELAMKVSEKLSLPIKYVSALEKVAKQLPKEIAGQIFPIKMYMREDWM
ncbi:MAG: ATP-binding protein [Maledivibacter sp.]|jgi:MinD-like ATPase involved in chromosome partitioning or flagellar assembly|nr:ATP-binding protein [Maledivibacter sp.]